MLAGGFFGVVLGFLVSWPFWCRHGFSGVVSFSLQSDFQQANFYWVASVLSLSFLALPGRPEARCQTGGRQGCPGAPPPSTSAGHLSGHLLQAPFSGYPPPRTPPPGHPQAPPWATPKTCDVSKPRGAAQNRPISGGQSLLSALFFFEAFFVVFFLFVCFFVYFFLFSAGPRAHSGNDPAPRGSRAHSGNDPAGPGAHSGNDPAHGAHEKVRNEPAMSSPSGLEALRAENRPRLGATEL